LSITVRYSTPPAGGTLGNGDDLMRAGLNAA
jgi:hypothetical protein